MSFSYAKFIARRGGVVLASGPPVESVPGPTRCCRDHLLQTWRSLKHEVNRIRCVLFMFSAIRRYRRLNDLVGEPTIWSYAVRPRT